MADYPYEIPPGYVEGASGSRTEPDGSVYRFANPPTLPAAPTPAPSYELNISAANDILKSEKADEALKRIQAANYFLNSRLLKSAMESGDERAAQAAAIGMFQSASGIGSLVNSLKKPQAYNFNPATSNSPAYFNPQGGGKPVIVPQGAMPPDLTLRKPEVTETTEGNVVQVPGSKGWRLVPKTAAPVETLHVRDFGPNPEAATNSAAPPRIMLTNRTIKATSPQAVTAPATPQGQVQEVARLTKDGRKAIYDATTKKFLRYATD